MENGGSYVRKLFAGGVFCGIAATVVTAVAISVLQFVSPGPNAHFSNTREALEMFALFPLLVMAFAWRFALPIGFVAGVIVSAYWQWGLRSEGSMNRLGIETAMVGAVLSIPVPNIVGAMGLPGFVVPSGLVLSIVVGAITAALYARVIGVRTARNS